MAKSCTESFMFSYSPGFVGVFGLFWFFSPQHNSWGLSSGCCKPEGEKSLCEGGQSCSRKAVAYENAPERHPGLQGLSKKQLFCSNPTRELQVQCPKLHPQSSRGHIRHPHRNFGSAKAGEGAWKDVRAHTEGLQGKWFSLNPTSSQGKAHRRAAIAACRIGTLEKSRSPSVSDTLSASEHRFLSPPVPEGNSGNPSSFPAAPWQDISPQTPESGCKHIFLCYYLGSSNVGETGTICKSNLFPLPGERSKGEMNRWDFQQPPVLASTATSSCLQSSCH